jgi:hypothetical protein
VAHCEAPRRRGSCKSYADAALTDCMKEELSNGRHGKKAILWRREVDNQPGMLANTLQPLSEAGIDLQVVMAYRYPDGENKAAIELHPVSGKKSVAAAQTAGLAPSSILDPAGRGRQSAGARPRDRIDRERLISDLAPFSRLTFRRYRRRIWCPGSASTPGLAVGNSCFY